MSFKIRKHKYPSDMDGIMVKLCDALNSMKGVKTTESCCGHNHRPTTVFFYCSDFESLARIQRAVDLRYTSCNIKWELRAQTVDTAPKNTPPIVFYIRSKEVYTDRLELIRDLEMLALDIAYYHTPFFNNWFHDTRSNREKRVDDKSFIEYMKRYDAIDGSYMKATRARRGHYD